LQERVVERLRERDDDASEARLGSRHSSIGQAWRHAIGLDRVEAALMGSSHDRPRDIGGVSIDHQPILSSGTQGRTQALAGRHAALHAPGMEQEREPRALRIPEAVLDGHEGERDFLAVAIHQVDVSLRAPRRHRTRELDVQAQRVLGKRVAGGMNGQDTRRVRGGGRR
jgi:hypothetical protein